MVVVTGWVTARDNIKCLPTYCSSYTWAIKLTTSLMPRNLLLYKYNLYDYASSNPWITYMDPKTQHLMYSVQIRGMNLELIRSGVH